MDKVRRAATPLKGFMKFVREQGVVGLAVGLAIGTQAGIAVQALVKGLINPIVSFIVGDTKGLENATWTIYKSSDRQLVIGWGLILSAIITLIAVAAVIYFVVHGLHLDRIDRKKDDTK
jgi:large conductance mechanosensitive channel